MARGRADGHDKNISGIPFLGTIFVLLGWRLIPLDFSPWVLLIVLTELPAIATFSIDETSESDDGAGAPRASGHEKAAE